MIILRYIATFFEVVNRKSMVEAARRLKMTPAAVSKHIQALEKELGIPLLKRSTRHLELTPEGKIYYPHAKNILESCHKAEAALSQSKEEPAGILKVVCGSQFVDDYLLPHLKEFLSKYPKITLDLALSQSIPDLEKESIDVVVGFTRDIPSTCIQRRLMTARWVLCASPDYLEEHGYPKKPIDLENYRLITHSNREQAGLITFPKGESVIILNTLTFNDTRAMRRSAIDGLGITLLHDYIVAGDIREGRLIPLLPKYMGSSDPITLYIAYLQAKQLHLKIRKFVDFLVEKGL